MSWSHNVTEAIALLPKSAQGLDVNPMFTSAQAFEATSDLILCDILGIRLVHVRSYTFHSSHHMSGLGRGPSGTTARGWPHQWELVEVEVYFGGSPLQQGYLVDSCINH